VLDFGIAKLLMLDNDQTKFYLGTLAYSSPEQMEGKELDQRSDIYSLGIMMFEMITGKMPLVASAQSFGAWYKTHHFQDPYSFAEVAPTLKAPKQLEDLIKSCLAKKPGERPQNIGEILKSLEAIEKDELRSHSQINPPVNPDHTPQKTVNVEIAIKQKTEFIPGALNYQTKKADLLPGNFTSLPETRADLPSAIIPPEINQDNIAKFISWPENKPIADIVFPQRFYHNDKVLPAIWVMLPNTEINKRLICTRYNQFLFIAIPHPMLLWVTVIYNRKHGPKWCPYYLDLKTTFGQEIVQLLQQTGYYHILLFARESPSQCVHVLHSSIAPSQCERLKEWLQTSYISRAFIDPQVSKNLLKREYEKIKPKIVSKLENIDTDSSFDLSG
jgi:serine/threonine-protein kinase